MSSLIRLVLRERAIPGVIETNPSGHLATLSSSRAGLGVGFPLQIVNDSPFSFQHAAKGPYLAAEDDQVPPGA